MTVVYQTTKVKRALAYAAAGTVALALAGSTFAFAQQPGPQGRGPDASHEMRQHWRISPEDMAALADARIAAVKAGLKLTPEQEKNWPEVESAVRDMVKTRIAFAQARHKRVEDKAQAEQRDPFERFKQRAEVMAQTAAGMKRIADAAEPLYKSLDDSQKHRLALLMRHGGRMGFGGWGMHEGRGRSWHHGWGRDGGPFGHDDDGPARL